MEGSGYDVRLDTSFDYRIIFTLTKSNPVIYAADQYLRFNYHLSQPVEISIRLNQASHKLYCATLLY